MITDDTIQNLFDEIDNISMDLQVFSDNPSQAGRKEFYSIGEVSDFCRLTRRALRYYGDAGLLQPDIVQANGYRYYSHETILRIPVIKYLKAMGFNLEQIQNIMAQDDFNSILTTFSVRLKECEDELKNLENSLDIIKGWSDAIEEARSVIKLARPGVNLKYLPQQNLLAMPYSFSGDYAETCLSISFNNYVEGKGNLVRGPVMFFVDDYFKMSKELELSGSYETFIVQEVIYPVDEEDSFISGQGLYATCYHIGPYAHLGLAYKKICSWVKDQGFKLAPGSLLRFVVDSWTTKNEEQFVTEVLIPLTDTGAYHFQGRELI